MVHTTREIPVETVGYAHCEPHKHGICWASILAGATAAVAVSFALLVLASSYGLAIASPWAGEGFSAAAIGVNAVIAMIIIQWLSSAVGGFLTGRLRSGWRVHTDEVAFRDIAHGFLTWAVATIVTVMLLGHAVSAVVGAGAQAATAGVAAEAASDNGTSDPLAYSVDTLFRADRSATAPATTDISNPEARAEVSRILARSVANDRIAESDRAYLSAVIANRTGISQTEANARIDNAITEVKEATDTARKAAATVAIFTFLSLVIGAFIGAIAGALGGRCRDDVPLTQ